MVSKAWLFTFNHGTQSWNIGLVRNHLKDKTKSFLISVCSIISSVNLYCNLLKNDLNLTKSIQVRCVLPASSVPVGLGVCTCRGLTNPLPLHADPLPLHADPLDANPFLPVYRPPPPRCRPPPPGYRPLVM